MVVWPRNCIGCGSAEVQKEADLSFDESEEGERSTKSAGMFSITWVTVYSFKERGTLFICSDCWNFAEAEQRLLRNSAKLSLLLSLILAIVLTFAVAQVLLIIDISLILVVLAQMIWVPLWSAANVLKFKNKSPFDSFYNINPKVSAAPISFRNKEFSEMFSVAAPYGSRYDSSIRLARRTNKEALITSALCLQGMILSILIIILIAIFSALLSNPSMLLPGVASGVLFLVTLTINRGFVALGRGSLPVYLGQNG